MEANEKKRIGLVLVSGDTALSLRFCSSVSRLAKSAGVALFVFAGGMPTKEQLLRNDFSSVILFADPCLFEENDSIDLSLFGATPCILVNFRQKGFSSLTCDLYPAAKKLLQHYLGDKRQIACIQGPVHNELAQQSFQAYRDILAENNLPLDFKLVSDLGLTELIDQRSLVPGIDFDAIYCFGSDQAFDIGMQLQSKGFDVPLVVCAAKGGNPLPSLILPISQMALSAWEEALSALPMDHVFDCEISLSNSLLRGDLFSNNQDLLAKVVQTYDLDAGHTEIIQQFIVACTHCNETMSTSLKGLSFLFLEEGGDLILLQELLYGFSLLQKNMQGLFLQLASHAFQMHASLFFKQQTLFARIQKAIADHEKQNTNILSEYLPLLGIRSCFIVQQQMRDRVVAGFYRNVPIEEGQSLFFDAELLPLSLAHLLKDSCWLDIPLNQEGKAGYMLLETPGCQPELLVLLQTLFSPLILSEATQDSDECVVAIGDGPGEVALLVSGTRKIFLHISEEFFPALQKGRPSLLIVDTVDVSFFNEIRSRPTTSSTPIIVVKDSFSSQDAEDVLLIPNLIMVHTSIATSRAFLVRLTSLIAGAQGIATMTAALVKGAIVYIGEHQQTQFSRWELAEAVNASEDYLGRVFRKEMGLPLWDYLHMHRVAIATDMLRQTPLTITEIANKTGFKDLAYFSRIFKKVMGFPPSKIRS